MLFLEKFYSHFTKILQCSSYLNDLFATGKRFWTLPFCLLFLKSKNLSHLVNEATLVIGAIRSFLRNFTGSNFVVVKQRSTSFCNCNCNLFTNLPWPRDNEGLFGLLSKAATCPPVYHTRWRLPTVPFDAECQAGKLRIPTFIAFYSFC